MNDALKTDPIKQAIDSARGCEVIDVTRSDTSLRVVHRVAKRSLGVWLAVMRYFLIRSKRSDTGMRFHACKHYFLTATDELQYTWTVNVQSDRPRAEWEPRLTQFILEATSRSPTRNVRLESYPLDGSDDRNAPEGPINPRATGYKQKGAQAIRG